MAHWIDFEYNGVAINDSMIANGVIAFIAFIVNLLLVVTLSKYGNLSVRKEYIVILSLWVNYWAKTGFCL